MRFSAAVWVVPSGAMFISILVLRGRLVHIAAAIVTFVAVLGFSPNAALAASVNVRIDLSDQRMSVRDGGKPAYYWAVSTARRDDRSAQPGQTGFARLHSASSRQCTKTVQSRSETRRQEHAHYDYRLIRT